MGIGDFLNMNGRARNNISRFEKWEMQSAIKECCKKKLTASISVDEHRLDFLSMFIDSNPDKKWITIDRLNPVLGNSHIKTSKFLLVSFILNGISQSFHSSYITDTGDVDGIIKISYPGKIESTQKREHFRVEPAIEDSISIYTTAKKETLLEINAPMVDISEGGLSFNIPHETAMKLREGDKLSPFRFTLPGAVTIETKGVVRNIFKTVNRQFTCGVEFIELTNEQISEIYTYVVDRQRDKIKRQAKTR